MMSASVLGCRSLTLPAGVRPLIFSAGSTLRRVTGSSAGVSPLASGSAKRSTMPKGAAANLASGGITPVATFSGKLAALEAARPLASWKPAGSSTVKAVFSGNATLKVTPLTSASPSPSSRVERRLEARRWPTSGESPSASLRDTGALKARRIGRIGRQAACAFSRSQLKLTENGSRTVKAKRFSTELGTPPGVATPLPKTICTFEAAVSLRLQVRVTKRKESLAASFSSLREASSAARAAPSMRRTGTRSPRPSTAHHTLACTLCSVAGPLSCSRKCWSSSMRWYVPGRMFCTNGPPVLNL